MRRLSSFGWYVAAGLFALIELALFVFKFNTLVRPTYIEPILYLLFFLLAPFGCVACIKAARQNLEPKPTDAPPARTWRVLESTAPTSHGERPHT